MNVDELLESAAEHHDAGRLAEAEGIYRQILAVHPDHADALYLFSLLNFQTGRYEEALAQADRALSASAAVSVDPLLASALHVARGHTLTALSRPGDAIIAYQSALDLFPGDANAMVPLANLLTAAGRWPDLIATAKQALAAQPKLADAWEYLGYALKQSGQIESAIDAYRHLTALRPTDATAWNNLGVLLSQSDRLDDAIAACRKARSLSPNDTAAMSNLAPMLFRQGRIEESLQCIDQSMALKPGLETHSRKLVTMWFDPASDAQAILKEHQHWNDLYAKPLAVSIRPHANDRAPDRRLRIGYVSPAFRQNTVSGNLLPLLQHRDRQQFEIYCYTPSPFRDEMTEKLSASADAWRNIGNQSDDQTADLISTDRIDILVDMHMHQFANSLLVFARKPAPVQVTFMAYPGTTGLTAIDYRLTDPYLDPPGKYDADYSERSIRLPHSFWCFDPSTDARLANLLPNKLPALTAGFVTLGCLNMFNKVSDPTLALWARVLAAVPNSRLLLLAPPGDARQRVVQSLGIPASRIDFVGELPRDHYMKQYHRIDIGLDTIPYNGHTSGLEAHWMGVPVITRLGPTVVSRAGYSILANLGPPDLAADSDDRFVEIAKTLAADLPRLGTLRSTLRERMEQSPLMDAKGFARSIETAYRQMWRSWCDSSP